MSGKLISERVWNQDQSWEYEHVFNLNDGDHIMRTTIRRNAYDAQSFGKVERWDGAEWKLVLTRSIDEMEDEVIGLSFVERGISSHIFDESAYAMELAAWEIVK